MAVVRNLIVRGGADFSAMRREMNSVQRSLYTFQATTSKIMKGIGVALAGYGLVSVMKDCVKAYNEVVSANMGLQSIIDGQGKNFDQAKQFIQSYVKDGLIPLSDAMTAYKQLSARGYSQDQTEKVMTRLKDSAAFNRQASLTMGEAVKSATEGLKNENSILVDNAGVTKNVSQMWADYARSIGKGEKSLTKQEKIQAEVNGIMEETKFQVGDAAKYASTLGGRLAGLSALFFQLKVAVGSALAPVLRAIIPIVATLLQTLTNAFNAISQVTQAIFGSNDVEQYTKTTNDQANAVDGLGDSYEKTGKKAKAALAGFDQLNTLSKPTKDAAASSTTTESKGKSKSSGNKNSLKDAVNGFMGKFNVQPLVNSFNKLKAAVAPLKKDLFAGLQWLYKNVLMPLAKFTIQDLIPAFLNLLAGCFKVLTPLIESFKPAALFLWDKFLKPIATWTAGAIVATLNGIGDALSKIGDWMKKNQKVIDGITTTVLAFFAAWKVTELLAFIQLSGGVISAIKKITTAIKAATIAQVASKFETMAIIALYAKDFIVGSAKMITQLGKQALSWVAVKGAAIAAKAAQVAAMVLSASPYIAAIAAVGIVIYELVKHWDDVKKAASVALDWIKKTWSKLGTWFDKSVVQPIKDTFTGLWDGITGMLDKVKSFFGGGSKIKVETKTQNNIKGTKVPKLATGGITNGPMMALIGDNPGGQEVVSPLDDLRSMLLETVKTAMQGNSRNQLPEIVLKVGETEFGRIAARSIRQAQRQAGVSIIPIEGR